ncbi:MAG: winged helix-turn-helix transcriptional regulator [Alphaproteobacteria bacterium]|nr:winged helix-turn-helix transcriptional regulator [Alphaproteobacteria bacterium]
MNMGLDNFTGLELWRRTIVEIVRQSGNDTDLSSRQTAILLNVYLTEPPHTVRALATDLNISKPAVSRAIDKLSVLGLIKRQTDEKDRRSVNLYRTIEGAQYIMRFGDIIAEKARKINNPLSEQPEK